MSPELQPSAGQGPSCDKRGGGGMSTSSCDRMAVASWLTVAPRLSRDAGHSWHMSTAVVKTCRLI